MVCEPRLTWLATRRRRIDRVELLSAIEHSAFCTWVREDSSLWAYPGILFIHSLGVAIVLGLSIVIDLRVLGFAPKLPVEPLDAFFPIIWAGVWMNAVSGTILFAIDATTKVTSPVFGVKMILVAAAVTVSVRLRRVVFRHRELRGPGARPGKWLAAGSLILWCGVTAAGRLVTYLSSV
jgi:hypothetical protein